MDLSYLVPLGDRTDSRVSWTVTSDFPDEAISRVCPLDFNGDGLTDVAVTSQPWSDMCVHLGQSGGQWDWFSVAGGAYTGLTDVKCGDIDGENRPDLVTITTGQFRGDRVAWWPNTLSLPKTYPPLLQQKTTLTSHRPLSHRTVQPTLTRHPPVYRLRKRAPDGHRRPLAG